MDCGAAESIARTHGTDETGAPRAHEAEPAACRRLRALGLPGRVALFAGSGGDAVRERTQLMVDVGDDGWLSSRKASASSALWSRASPTTSCGASRTRGG